jgi:transcriptional regulator GlxA family with amidase domain
VTRYFSSNFARAISIPEMSEHIQITLEQIEYAFDNYRKTTATQALLEYRLNRLCDQMCKNPSEGISEQIIRCGLVEFQSTNLAFETYFGIDIVEFHKQCFIAAASRCQRSKNEVPSENELIGDKTEMILKETRFHRNK